MTSWGNSGWGRDQHMPAGQYRLPADVEALSLTLKRSHLYPRSPGLIGQAIDRTMQRKEAAILLGLDAGQMTRHGVARTQR